MTGRQSRFGPPLRPEFSLAVGWRSRAAPRSGGATALGYGYLADQLEQARAMGLDAEAAPAWGVGPAAMVRCCQQAGVTHVILPATLARPSLLDNLLRRRVADFRDKLAGLAIVLVGPDEVLQKL